MRRCVRKVSKASTRCLEGVQETVQSVKFRRRHVDVLCSSRRRMRRCVRKESKASTRHLEGVQETVQSIDSLIKGLTSDKNSDLSGVQNVGYLTAMELFHLTSKSVELFVSRQHSLFFEN